MNVYKINSIRTLLEGNSYVGRGIIMGRSENSRNRIFVKQEDEIIIHPFDASKVSDPSLIIYTPIRTHGKNLIVTNGDQTDTICRFLEEDKSFEQALNTRCFEPDYPNFTPRISGMITFGTGDICYQMSILKSADEKGSACNRYTFSFTSLPGLGHFIHTYICDGNPIPTGEPERINIPNDIDEFTQEIWTSLDENNKISLYVRYTDIETSTYSDILLNKNK